MLNALKSSARTQPILFPTALPNQIGRKSTQVRFMQQAPPGGRQPEKSSMDKNPKPSSKTTDTNTMSSFGDGYATRSDEEGFGGVYGGNQYLNKQDEENIMDGKSTPNDASQGSVVKEKEMARNQKNV